MKKTISMILALTLVMALFAGCGATKPAETTPTTTEAAVNAPASALEILETVWGTFPEEQKFPVIGGSMADPQDGKPGSYDLADENITYSLLIPADQLANVTEAASMIHMMNSNTFTVGAFRLAEGVTAADFGAAMKEAVMNNQWMCGFPETLLIQDIAGEYVLVAFGVNEIINPFIEKLAESYPDAVTLTQEAII